MVSFRLLHLWPSCPLVFVSEAAAADELALLTNPDLEHQWLRILEGWLGLWLWLRYWLRLWFYIDTAQS